jgi:hypothetical protein
MRTPPDFDWEANDDEVSKATNMKSEEDDDDDAEEVDGMDDDIDE